MGAGVQVDVGADDSVLRGATFDQFVWVDGANFGDCFNHGFGQGSAVVGVLFVEIKAVRFPVFVQQEAKVEVRLAFEPGDVRGDFLGGGFQVVAVQIDAAGILAGVAGTGKSFLLKIVEQRADMPGDGSFFGEKASHGVAQRDLLVGQL